MHSLMMSGSVDVSSTQEEQSGRAFVIDLHSVEQTLLVDDDGYMVLE